MPGLYPAPTLPIRRPWRIVMIGEGIPTANRSPLFEELKKEHLAEASRNGNVEHERK